MCRMKWLFLFFHINFPLYISRINVNLIMQCFQSKQFFQFILADVNAHSVLIVVPKRNFIDEELKTEKFWFNYFADVAVGVEGEADVEVVGAVRDGYLCPL